MKQFIQTFAFVTAMFLTMHVQAENYEDKFPAKPDALISPQKSTKRLITQAGQRSYEGNRIICSGDDRVCYHFDTETNTLYLPAVNGVGGEVIEVDYYEITDNGIIYVPR